MKPFSILLVEDNSDHAELATDCLVSDAPDLHLVHCTNGHEALACLSDALRYDKALPNLILLDLNLPVLSGFDVLHRIKTDPDLRQVPIVVVSTSLMPKDIVKALQMHANSYVAKSRDFVLWERSLRAVRDYWRDVDQSSKHEPGKLGAA